MNASYVKLARAASVIACFVLSVATAFAQPAVGPNVNMVSGTRWPEGDPFLTKQNEPSLAVSSRNPRHLLAGSNDYRLVPAEIAESLADPEAWIQVYKSVDGGESWYSTPLGGCPLNIPECTDSTGLTAPLRNLQPNFGADPTVRPGPYGTFFLSFIAGTRNTSANGVVAVQRFVDKNNDVQRGTDVRGTDAQGRPFVRPAQDPILPDSLSIIDTGTPGQGKDKPWVVADVGGRSWNAGKTCTLLGWTNNRSDVAAVPETVPAFNVYVSYANFVGKGQQQTQIKVAVSSDCGKTFFLVKLSPGYLKGNQGTSMAVDPQNGALYVVWRNFDGPQVIYMSKSTDGGNSWNGPIQVASFNAYDQGSTNVSIRTLGFPTLAVSVGSDGKSRVHVAWAQRKAAPSASSPYGCPSANPADCDARIVMSTSLDGGNTWPTPVAVDTPPAGNDPFHPNVGRGNQIQPSMTSAAGKILITWLDQRLDATEGVLQCPGGGLNCPLSQMQEVRQARGNLDPNCTFPAAVQSVIGKTSCYIADVVFTPYISDGTKYLVRRHTLDVFAASALPADVPSFTSSRVSQYAFGTTVQATFNQAKGKWDPVPGTYAIRQKEVNPVNLPLFANGTGAFLGDYIDVAAPLIVASTDSAHPYKFNVGGNANTQFTTSGRASTFHIAFTDNRDVIPPYMGDWTTPTCSTSAFTKDGSGNITGVTNANSCNGTLGTPGGPGYSGNRNQNVYSAVVSDHSLAYANFNSKLLNASTPRGFVVTVQNLSSRERNYTLDLNSQPAGTTATFDKVSNKNTSVKVQPGSSATRFVWATSSNSKSQVLVNVTNAEDPSWTTQVVLNPDANGVFVTNGDGTNTDLANDGLGAVVLSNAVLTNNALSNNALSNAVLSNNALTNAVLSNVVLSNGALSNLAPGGSTDQNVALSNAVLSNVVLSNVVLSNQSIGNVALSNAVLSNVVLTNNALNVALSNLDPTNVALSNVVLSNNALTNVVLSNLDPNNALSNAMLSNVVLSNAALSNVVLSNNALSNNALSNNVLSNVALSNATIQDQQTASQTTNNPDADPLRAIEKGSPELTSNNTFTSTDIQNSSVAGLGFKETMFTVRNHGNTDTMLSVKMLLRDAVGCTGALPYNSCQPPPTFKLQVTLRKVAFNPSAIPPTNPAVSSGQTFRIGLAQRNSEVSNVGTLALIDPADPNFGKFQPLDPNAATLPLAAGEWAYVTIRAIGVNGSTPPDPADLLQWGTKPVSENATTTTGPLIITTQSFPNTARLFVARQAETPTVNTFGGTGTITGTAICTDKNGNQVFNGTGAPTSNIGTVGSWYIDTAGQLLYGPKTLAGWPGAGVPQIDSTPRQGDPQPGPHVIQPWCPLPPVGTAVSIGGFTNVAGTQVSNANLSFTAQYWGDYYTQVAVKDSTSTGAPNDQQVIKVHVDPAIPNLVFTPPATATFNQTGTLQPIDLGSGTHSDSPVTITYTATGTCSLALDGHTLVISHASASPPTPDCLVSANQLGNQTFAPISVAKSIFIDRAQQAITVDAHPADNYLSYLTGNLPLNVAGHVTSRTAPDSHLAVTFSSTTPGVCTVDPNTGALTIVHQGLCTIAFDQAGNGDYYAASQVPSSFQIAKANQVINFTQPADMTYGNGPQALIAASTSPTAPPSGIPVTFSTTTSAVCTVAGTSMTGATVTIVTPGTCSVTADQAAGPDYNAAPSVTKTFTINKANQKITFGAAPTATFGDPPVTVSATSATVQPPSGTAAGPSGIPVTFSSQTPAVCTNVGTTVSILAAGTCTIAADQAGNTFYNAAPQVTQSFIVAKAPTTITVASTFFTPLGSPTTLNGTATRTGVATVFPTDNVSITVLKGAVTSKSYSPAIGPPSGAFSVIDAAPLLASDSYSVKFSYPGNANFAAATDVISTLRIEGFSAAANMLNARTRHATVLLQDGRVLVTGGAIDSAGTPTNTAEIYCPDPLPPSVSATQCPTAGAFSSVTNMSLARAHHTATVLPDGKVIVVGGVPGTPPLDEIWDGQTWSSMTIASERGDHTATLLNDGRVFIAGGSDSTGATLNTTWIYDPATHTSTAGPTLQTPRERHTATLLPDGKVLIAGGRQANTTPPPPLIVLPSAEIFDPVAGTTTTVATTMGDPRFAQSDVLLTDGRALIAGGSSTSNSGTSLASADFFASGALSPLLAAPTGALIQARRQFSMTKLVDDWVLAVGGLDLSGIPSATSELFKPGTGFDRFMTGASLANARTGHTATRLLDGRVLILGGNGTATTPINSAELYNGPSP